MKNVIACIWLALLLALCAGVVGCTGEYVPEITKYSLTVSAAEGGDVTTPGEGAFTYRAGEVVDLVAVAGSGYGFANWAGDVGCIADPHAAVTTVTMNDNYSITANFYGIPATYYFEGEGVAFPNPDFGATLTGPINEEGYIHPSDLQRHSFFAGTT